VDRQDLKEKRGGNFQLIEAVEKGATQKWGEGRPEKKKKLDEPAGGVRGECCIKEAGGRAHPNG